VKWVPAWPGDRVLVPARLRDDPRSTRELRPCLASVGARTRWGRFSCLVDLIRSPLCARCGSPTLPREYFFSGGAVQRRRPELVSTWLEERRGWPGAQGQALFRSRKGARFTSRSIDLVIRSVGSEAGLSLSAHGLRHSCLTNLVRAGSDVVLVAEIGGHRRLETATRYRVPSAADRQAVMEAIRVEY
jgi:hypothetical protein